MLMGNIYNELDDHIWVVEDYTDVNALALTGTIYSDKVLTTAFDGTGYTLTIRFKDYNGDIVYENDEDVEWVTAASGTWRFKPDQGSFIVMSNGEIYIQLEKTGTQKTAFGVNGSADLTVISG